MSARVIVVPGTWAPDWLWPELEEAVAKGLSVQPSFEYFEWSGRNSFFSRLVAARRLELHLRQQVAHADTPIYIIGHSHGGTIAVLALHDSDLCQRASLAQSLPDAPVALAVTLLAGVETR